jgi:hypothetical protein
VKAVAEAGAGPQISMLVCFGKWGFQLGFAFSLTYCSNLNDRCPYSLSSDKKKSILVVKSIHAFDLKYEGKGLFEVLKFYPSNLERQEKKSRLLRRSKI